MSVADDTESQCRQSTIQRRRSKPIEEKGALHPQSELNPGDSGPSLHPQPELDPGDARPSLQSQILQKSSCYKRRTSDNIGVDDQHNDGTQSSTPVENKYKHVTKMYMSPTRSNDHARNTAAISPGRHMPVEIYMVKESETPLTNPLNNDGQSWLTTTGDDCVRQNQCSQYSETVQKWRRKRHMSGSGIVGSRSIPDRRNNVTHTSSLHSDYNTSRSNSPGTCGDKHVTGSNKYTEACNKSLRRNSCDTQSILPNSATVVVPRNSVDKQIILNSATIAVPRNSVDKQRILPNSVTITVPRNSADKQNILPDTVTIAVPRNSVDKPSVLPNSATIAVPRNRVDTQSIVHKSATIAVPRNSVDEQSMPPNSATIAVPRNSVDKQSTLPNSVTITVPRNSVYKQSILPDTATISVPRNSDKQGILPNNVTTCTSQSQHCSRQRHCSGSDSGDNRSSAGFQRSASTLSYTTPVSHSQTSPHSKNKNNRTLKPDTNTDKYIVECNLNNKSGKKCMLSDKCRAKINIGPKSHKARRKRYSSGSDSGAASLSTKRFCSTGKTLPVNIWEYYEAGVNESTSVLNTTVTINPSQEDHYAGPYTFAPETSHVNVGSGDLIPQGYQHNSATDVIYPTWEKVGKRGNMSQSNSLPLEGGNSHNKDTTHAAVMHPTWTTTSSHTCSKSVMVDLVLSTDNKRTSRKRPCSGTCSPDVGNHSDDTCSLATKRSRSAAQIGRTTDEIEDSNMKLSFMKHNQTDKTQITCRNVPERKSYHTNLNTSETSAETHDSVNKNKSNKSGNGSSVDKISSLVNQKETVIQKIHETIVQFDKPQTMDPTSMTGIPVDINELDSIIPLHSEAIRATSREKRNPACIDRCVLVRKHPADTIWDSIVSEYYEK